MLKIAICDDDISFVQQVTELIREYLRSATSGIPGGLRPHRFFCHPWVCGDRLGHYGNKASFFLS